MLKTIPHVAAETSFALKGGTAINLFVREMPRLSVDVDLAYLLVDEPRNTALIGIDGIEKLPAVQWKLTNIKKIPAKKQKELLEKLRRVLGL